MGDIYQEISLAGLLHDVGKIGQRAYPSGKGLSEQSLRMEDSLCPKDLKSKQPSHLHVLYTNEFCQQLAEFYPPDLNPSRIANLASYHHNPEDDLQKIIQEADVLSSAMERLPEEGADADSRTAFRRIHLRSITSEILSETPVKEVWGHNIRALDEDVGIIMPQRFPAEKESLTGDYLHLWEGLTEAWNQNRLTDPWKFINRSIATLEPFTWCVPSATNVRPDISLFDHLKTTSAIAGCLYRCRTSERLFLLVTGDYGGIQNYIFDLKHGAGQLAKCLRGRSFYVRTCAEAISLQILKSCGCTASHRIMQAGGRFYLLLPNDDGVRQTLEDTQKNLDQWILDRKNGELRFSLGWTEITKDELAKDFPGAKKRADEDLSRQKQKPLSRVLWQREGGEDFWIRKELQIAEEEGLCESCRKQVGSLQYGEEGEEKYICADCQRDRSDGQKLTRGPILSILDKPASQDGRLPFFEYEIKDRGSLKTLSAEDALAMLDFQGQYKAPPKIPLMPCRLARYVPIDDQGKIIDFGEIAEESAGKLGYLKADVDNLGYIFQRGFKREGQKERPDETSISRLATLSRMLELFFASYFEWMLSDKYKDAYLVYSGGDDVLVIGPWNQMFDLALDLRSQFRKFTCENEAWSISAGVAVVGSRTPVIKAVQMADHCLEQSKKRERKNALTAFDTTFGWRDAEEALDRAKLVLGWLEDRTLNSSKIHRLLLYAQMHRELEKTNDNYYLRYIPQLIYDLKRNWKGHSDRDKQSERDALRWALTLTNPADHPIRQSHFICQYALYGIRGGGGSRDDVRS